MNHNEQSYKLSYSVFLLKLLNKTPLSLALQSRYGTKEAAQKLLLLANVHGIIPHFHKAAKETLFHRDEAGLEMQYQTILQANLLLTAHLLTATKALEENNYPYLSIKGSTLAQELYQDISMRQFSDIDIFVDEKDIYQISELLIELGYTPVLPLSLLKRKKFLELDNDFSFRHNKTNALLELHWKLFPKRHKMSLPFSELYSRSVKLSLQNRKINTLSPEDNLLYLSLHGAKHIFERYEWVYDLDRLIRTYPDLDLVQLYHHAKDIQVETPFLLGIFLSHSLFKTPIPEALKAYKTAHIQKLIDGTKSYYDQDFVYWDESDKKRARFLFLAKLFQHKEAKALWLFKSLFKTTPVDVITFNLPDTLAFLYPLLRPFRLIYKHLFAKKPRYA